MVIPVEQELASIAAKLVTLEKDKDDLLRHRRELMRENVPAAVQADRLEGKHFSTDEKVEIFSRYFRGRDDIYATRWESKQGNRGYSLACDNEWKPGLCRKPEIKCSECSNSKFKALDRKAIFAHLSGKHTIGLYPLLTNNHCWLLAMDFDKSDWQAAVIALSSVCKELHLPCLIERSRSGAGAHLWLFFDLPIKAKIARDFGFALLDKAMEKHAGLSFESYDRLFPNQDILPEGGFGNLIALPLQHRPRESGNSEFVDECLQPYPDQWQKLASVGRVSLPRVVAVIEQSSSDGRADAFELKPWEKGLPVKKIKISGCPDNITLVLANRIYLPVAELPQALQAQLKRLASFSNPVFFKTQALRFSTNGIPRFICTAYFDQGYLSLPRGCLDDVCKALEACAIEIIIDDKRCSGRKLAAVGFVGELRKEQKKAVTALLKNDVGVLHAPTAFGKTITAIGLIAKRKVNTLILVHTRQLLDQWAERLSMFLVNAEIGVVGGGKRKPTGQIDIATYQSLIKNADNSVDEILFDYGQVIIDECHHISAAKYEMLLGEVRAKYVLGMTATIQRQDGHQPIIFMQAGPVRHRVKSDKSSGFEQRVVSRQFDTTPPAEFVVEDARTHIADIYRWLMNDEGRNKQIVSDVLEQLRGNRHPLILTERREHATILSEMLISHGVNALVLRGRMRVKERKKAMDALIDAQVLVATGKYIGEGFDLPRLDTLFLALPISWKGTLAQYAGRIHRLAEGKERVVIYDYVETRLPMLVRMYRRRCKGYHAMGYAIDEGSVDGQDQGVLHFDGDELQQ